MRNNYIHRNKKSLLMKKLFLIAAVSSVFGFAQAQDNKQTTTEKSSIQTSTAADPKVEALKEKHNAPNRADFKTEEEYAEAKEAWILANPKVYEEINQVKPSETRPKN